MKPRRTKALRDHWREFVAAGQLPPCRLEVRRGEPVRLFEGERLRFEFHDADVPGLTEWLHERVPVLYSAANLADPDMRSAPKKSSGGKKSGAARDPTTAHPALTRLIRNALARGENPRQYVAFWIDEYDLSRSSLYRLIARVESPPPEYRPTK